MRKMPKKDKIGMFAGRFQPFHNGHVAVIEQILQECKHVVIVIGSADVSHTPDNPFTSGERYEMIYDELMNREVHPGRVHIIPVQDINRYDLWVKHVVSICPTFNIIYAHSQFTKRLFKEAGYMLAPTKLADRETVESGTAIRKMMVEEGNWAKYVPDGTRNIIAGYSLIERVQAICDVEERYK